MTLEVTAPHSLVLPGINIDQYFGLWAISIDPFQAVVERWNGVNLHAHITSAAAQAAAAEQAKQQYEMTTDGIAMIPIRGTLMKGVSSMSEGSSLTILRRKVSLAAADERVKGIMLLVDTPGGTTAGTADAADAIARASAAKPTVAFVEDLCCSAGVWLVSQAGRVVANQASAVYGSIGVYATLLDSSKRAEQLGVKVHVLRSGPLKGAGTPGDTVTPEQVANMQAYVDTVHGQFLAAVASGRKRSVASIQEHADGGIFTAAQAVDRGLVDAIQNFDAAYAELVGMTRAKTKPGPIAGARRMSDTQSDNTPKPATIAELKAACPGAPSNWLLEQVEAGATLAAAQTAFIAHQAKELESAKAAAAKAGEDAKAKGGGGLGVSLPARKVGAATNGDDSAAESTGDPVADFNAAVTAARRSDTSLTRIQAVQVVARQNPALHKAYLLATNDTRAVGMIEDRFRKRV